MLYYKGMYQVGMMSMEPQTGYVKAWVGGNDFQSFKYDHVKQESARWVRRSNRSSTLRQ